jgi:hypothetical protein
VVARQLIRATAQKLRKHADQIKDDSSADAFHKVRIRAKRLRYAIDAFSGLYGGAAHEYLAALAKLQQVLGEYHDSTVRAERFAEPGHERPTRTGGYVVSSWDGSWNGTRESSENVSANSQRPTGEPRDVAGASFRPRCARRSRPGRQIALESSDGRLRRQARHRA